MAKKSVTDYKQWGICILSGLLLIRVGGFFITLGLIVTGGLAGFILYNKSLSPKEFTGISPAKKKKNIPYLFFSILGMVIISKSSKVTMVCSLGSVEGCLPHCLDLHRCVLSFLDGDSSNQDSMLYMMIV